MNTPEHVTEYPVTLDVWNCTISVLVTENGIYIPLRQLCAVLGIADAQYQAERLQEKKAAKKYMCKLPIMTGRGRRRFWCLHRKLVGYWLGYISDKRVRPEMADHVIEFQDDVIEAADRCLFQDVGTTVTIDSTIIPISRRLGPVNGPVIFAEDGDEDMDTEFPITGTLSVGPCPNCNSRLKVILTENGNFLQEESA